MYKNKIVQKRIGMTFVELIMCVIIIGIMVGTYYIHISAETERARTTVCLSNRNDIVSQYNINRIMGTNLSFKDNVELIRKYYHNAGSTSSNRATFENLCPGKGSIRITNKGDGHITVECSKHLDIYSSTMLERFAEEIFEVKNSLGGNWVQDYFNNDPTRVTLDSTGIHHGQPITEILGKSLGLNLAGYDWQIQRISGSNYFVFLAGEKILKEGQTVMVSRYNSDTKEMIDGTAVIKKNTRPGQDNLIIDYDSFEENEPVE